jgi:hypothetical protein
VEATPENTTVHAIIKVYPVIKKKTELIIKLITEELETNFGFTITKALTN